MTERAVPFYCPYCGDEDLEPYESDGGWHCRACTRAFRLRFVGMGAVSAAADPGLSPGGGRHGREASR
jgi:tRNA(Ile2) C34 agmatinyltransferase TiaS